MIDFQKERTYIIERNDALIIKISDNSKNGMVCAEDAEDALHKLEASALRVINRLEQQAILNESKRR